MDLKIPPVVVVLITALLMWWVAENTDIGAFGFGGQRSITAALILAAIALLIASVVTFRMSDTTVDPVNPERASELVTRGIYQISRNPMYLAMLTLLTAEFIGLGKGLNIFLLIGFIAYMTSFQIIPEEQALQSKFNDAYLEYKRQVRRWL